ncbi:MAG: hypothetical protein KR126chlam2_00446 [Chlamydiae bacterium]|nr:hypothetical protein [Chlamydiota bacterium]
MAPVLRSSGLYPDVQQTILAVEQFHSSAAGSVLTPAARRVVEGVSREVERQLLVPSSELPKIDVNAAKKWQEGCEIKHVNKQKQIAIAIMVIGTIALIVCIALAVHYHSGITRMPITRICEETLEIYKSSRLIVPAGFVFSYLGAVCFGFSTIGAGAFYADLREMNKDITSLSSEFISKNLKKSLHEVHRNLYRRNQGGDILLTPPRTIGPIVRTGKYLSTTEAAQLSALLKEYSKLSETEAEEAKASLEKQWRVLQGQIMLRNSPELTEIDPNSN